MTAAPAIFTAGSFHALDRITLLPDRAGSEGAYNERWLQELNQRCPGVLPIDEIEHGVGDLVLLRGRMRPWPDRQPFRNGRWPGRDRRDKVVAQS